MGNKSVIDMYKIVDGNNVMVININKFVDVNYWLVCNFIGVDKYLSMPILLISGF